MDLCLIIFFGMCIIGIVIYWLKAWSDHRRRVTAKALHRVADEKAAVRALAHQSGAYMAVEQSLQDAISHFRGVVARALNNAEGDAGMTTRGMGLELSLAGTTITALWREGWRPQGQDHHAFGGAVGGSSPARPAPKATDVPHLRMLLERCGEAWGDWCEEPASDMVDFLTDACNARERLNETVNTQALEIKDLANRLLIEQVKVQNLKACEEALSRAFKADPITHVLATAMPWMAVQSDGRWFACTHRPKVVSDVWMLDGMDSPVATVENFRVVMVGTVVTGNAFLPGCTNWCDSLLHYSQTTRTWEKPE